MGQRGERRKEQRETSLVEVLTTGVVKTLSSNAGSLGSIPSQGTRSHMLQLRLGVCSLTQSCLTLLQPH